MFMDRVEFVGKGDEWEIPWQTHDKTFDYFNLLRVNFKGDLSIASGHFIINLTSKRIMQMFVQWIECGVLDCRTCMAPLGTAKREPNRNKTLELLDPLRYRSHRQDQAVLSLLLYNYTRSYHDANVKLAKYGIEGRASTAYLCLQVRRGEHDKAKNLSDWKTATHIASAECVSEEEYNDRERRL